jgi:hypothetical protein
MRFDTLDKVIADFEEANAAVLAGVVEVPASQKGGDNTKTMSENMEARAAVIKKAIDEASSIIEELFTLKACGMVLSKNEELADKALEIARIEEPHSSTDTQGAAAASSGVEMKAVILTCDSIRLLVNLNGGEGVMQLKKETPGGRRLGIHWAGKNSCTSLQPLCDAPQPDTSYSIRLGNTDKPCVAYAAKEGDTEKTQKFIERVKFEAVRLLEVRITEIEKAAPSAPQAVKQPADGKTSDIKCEPRKLFLSALKQLMKFSPRGAAGAHLSIFPAVSPQAAAVRVPRIEINGPSTS